MLTRLASQSELPAPGQVKEFPCGDKVICVANVDGTISAMENVCLHRGGPLGQGWLEGKAVVCPWHSWAFDTTTGQALPPDQGKVDVLPLKAEGDDLLIDLGR